MEIFNLVFYVFMAVMVFIIFLGVVGHKEIRSVYHGYYYWSLALILMVTSCIGFLASGFCPYFFLSLGNTSLIFSSFAIFLFIRSWDQNNKRLPPQYFWVALAGFLVLYEFLRIYLSFGARVYFVTFVLGVLSLLGLVELYLIPKKDRTRHFLVLKLTFLIHIILLAVRVFGISYGMSSGAWVATIYEEGPFTGMLRILGVASNLLVYLAIGNILLEEVWRKEEKKSTRNELRMISSLNELARARDNETGSHIVRTTSYVRLLALRLKLQGSYPELLNERFIEILCQVAPLHDIGKVGIPDSILSKQGALTDEERTIIKTHALIGETVLNSSRSQFPEEGNSDIIKVAIDVAGSHHEQWDGSGYPRGLVGESIPLAARIVGLADMYDALISERVYKKSWTHDEVVIEIMSKKGTHFDPVLVEAFILEQDRFQEIFQKHRDDASKFSSLYAKNGQA